MAFLRFVQFLVCCTVCILLMEPMHAEARGRRTRRQPLVSLPRVDDIAICPLFVWMNHGSYCSYYATGYTSCTPQNYDSADCSLHSGGCSTGIGCLPLSAARDGKQVFVASPVEKDGYGDANGSPAPEVVGGQLPGANLRDLDIRSLVTKTLKFKGPGPDPIYAQIFIAYVIPRVQPPNQPPIQGVYVTRGMQVAGPIAKVDYDFTATPAPVGASIREKAGFAHAYLFSATDNAACAKEVTIVLHRSTQGHP